MVNVERYIIITWHIILIIVIMVLYWYALPNTMIVKLLYHDDSNGILSVHSTIVGSSRPSYGFIDKWYPKRAHVNSCGTWCVQNSTQGY